MSSSPPRGPWSDLLEQVRDALEDAGLGAGEVRDEVVHGVSEALRALRGDGIPGDLPEEDVADPSVGVVEGGRAPGAPPTPGPRPDLHVASAPEGEAVQEPAPPRVQVTLRTAPGLQALEGVACFVLEDGAAQTLYRGAAPHPYRVVADFGSLRLLLDGSPAETLEAGQSIDVDASHLRVLAEGGGAQGRFLRLAR